MWRRGPSDSTQISSRQCSHMVMRTRHVRAPRPISQQRDLLSDSAIRFYSGTCRAHRWPLPARHLGHHLGNECFQWCQRVDARDSAQHTVESQVA